MVLLVFISIIQKQSSWLRVLSNRSSISLTKWTVVVVAQHAEEINE